MTRIDFRYGDLNLTVFGTVDWRFISNFAVLHGEKNITVELKELNHKLFTELQTKLIDQAVLDEREEGA